MEKTANRRVGRKSCSESLVKVERGTGEAAEDGLGVGGSIGRLARVRPLLRFEANFGISICVRVIPSVAEGSHG